jgi:hypothetical protein
MAKLASFAGVTKSQDDLFTKGYCFSNHFGLKLIDRSNSGVIANASISAVKEAGSSTIATGAHFEKQYDSGLLVKLSLDGAQKLKAAFEYLPPDNSHVKLTSELSGEVGKADTLAASLSSEFIADKFRAKIGVFAGPKFKLTGVFGEEQAGAGLDIEFDAVTSRFTSYNWLVYWSHLTTRLALKHVGSNASQYELGPFKLSYFTSLSNQTNLGAELSMGVKEHEPCLQFGLQHSFSDALTSKVRVNEKGLMATSVRHLLNDYASLTTSSSLNFSRGLSWPLLDLGFKLKLSS